MPEPNPDRQFLEQGSLPDLQHGWAFGEGFILFEGMTLAMQPTSDDPEAAAARWHNLRFGAVESLEEWSKRKPSVEIMDRFDLGSWREWLILLLEPIADYYGFTCFEVMHAWAHIYGERPLAVSVIEVEIIRPGGEGGNGDGQ